MTNERLQKAIERNKARMAKRERKKSFESSANNNSTFGKEKRNWSNFNKAPKSATPPSRPIRQFAANQKGFKFNPALRKSPNKAPAKINYLTKNKGLFTELKEAVKKKCVFGLILLGWGLCFFMLIRLITIKRGVLDYYSREGAFKKNIERLHNIEKNNVNLSKQIDFIKTNRPYQKKLVRDHLGFIAADEFLILFPKETKKKSI